jgi:hypothetical protein
MEIDRIKILIYNNMKILKKFKKYFGNTEIDEICKKYKIVEYDMKPLH